MKKLVVLLSVVLVGIGVALTYHIFENLVHGSINLVWYDWFNTDTYRLLVIPLTVVLSLLFFGLQHYLDPASEKKQEHGLGEMPAPTVSNFLKVLLIGYFSLLAGASLGPEAILVPACMILGAFIGTKLFAKKQPQLVKLLAAAAIMALFTAFFNSFVIGVLSIFLVVKQAKTKISPILLITAVVASATSYFTLKLISGEAYAALPATSWKLNVETVLLGILLVACGYGLSYILVVVSKLLQRVRQATDNYEWWQRALVAAAGIAFLYLIGGTLVEFTGNKSIVPLFNEAASLGLIGLVWILVVKIVLIGWSKVIGYRGGMIFPTIFLASVLVAIVQLYQPGFNLTYGLIAVIAGALAANAKTHILA